MILKECLNYKKINYKWIPYKLNEERRQNRIKICKKMLLLLKDGDEKKIMNIITCDETFINCSNPFKKYWKKKDEEFKKIPKKFPKKKFLIFVSFTMRGLLSVYVVPNNNKINSEIFSNDILDDMIEELYKTRPSKFIRDFILHFDNASTHTSKKTKEKIKTMKLRILEHPSYSPDLAPCDFFLFGYLKETLRGIEINDEKECYEIVVEKLNQISKEVYKKVFLEWIKRLKWVISNNGDYYN